MVGWSVPFLTLAPQCGHHCTSKQGVEAVNGGSSLGKVGGGTQGVSGTMPFGPNPCFPCLKHFLPEETPLVSQGISFKFDDLVNMHTNPPPPPHRSFLIRFARIARTNFLKKGGLFPHSPPAVALPLEVVQTCTCIVTKSRFVSLDNNKVYKACMI